MGKNKKRKNGNSYCPKQKHSPNYIERNVRKDTINKKESNVDTNLLNYLKNAFTEHCYSDKELQQSTKLINYFHATNGLFEIEKNEIGLFPVRIEQPSPDAVEYYEPKMVLNLPKIPEIELLKIKKFFKDICDKYGSTEAMTHIYWDKKNKEYITIVSEQNASAAHVSYKRDLKFEKDDNLILVMDIHSHDTMSAFFSGVDDRDERETRLYGVIGHVTSPTMSMKFRYGLKGKFVELQEEDIFESTYIQMNEINYPFEWLDKVKTYNYSWNCTKDIYNRPFVNNYTEINETEVLKNSESKDFKDIKEMSVEVIDRVATVDIKDTEDKTEQNEIIDKVQEEEFNEPTITEDVQETEQVEKEKHLSLWNKIKKLFKRNN